MTDDLVTRLRDSSRYDSRLLMREAAADRIERMHKKLLLASALVKEAEDRTEELENLFPAILEYLEQEADVVDGDNGVPYPNAAMSLLVWTRHALGEKKND